VLTLPPSVRVFVAVGATDMRLGMDGLSALARSRLRLDPLSGHLILFRNRRGDRLKILMWDRSGFWVLYKRLEKGTFSWPRAAVGERVELRTSDLLLLLSGADITRPRHTRWYDRLSENIEDEPLATTPSGAQIVGQ
jgi:transposase